MSHLDPKAKGSIAAGRGNGFGALTVGADGKVLVARSSAPLGLAWEDLAPTGLLPLWLFGNGMDGSLTLAMNTTLGSTDRILYYVNLDLAGFTLETATLGGNTPVIIFISNTLTLGGGVLRGGQASSATPGGVAGGATAGAGGDSGFGREILFVHARAIAGTGHIHCDGSDGADGGNASAQPATQARSLGADGNAGGGAFYVTGSEQVTLNPDTFAQPGLAPGAVYTGGTGGVGGDGVTTETGTFQRNDWDWPFVGVGFLSLGTYSRSWGPGVNGASGGGGNEAEGSVGPAVGKDGEAGAGGGGGGMAWGDGGHGGAGGDGTGHDGTHSGPGASGPGGGGGGAGGGFVLVVTNSAPSTLTLSANGGKGGKGGTGVDGGGGTPARSGGGGGGGGGAGGVAGLLAQAGNGAAVTAAGGTKGLGGSSGGAGSTAGSDGTDGSVGRAVSLSYNP